MSHCPALLYLSTVTLHFSGAAGQLQIYETVTVRRACTALLQLNTHRTASKFQVKPIPWGSGWCLCKSHCTNCTNNETVETAQTAHIASPAHPEQTKQTAYISQISNKINCITHEYPYWAGLEENLIGLKGLYRNIYY